MSTINYFYKLLRNGQGAGAKYEGYVSEANGTYTAWVESGTVNTTPRIYFKTEFTGEAEAIFFIQKKVNKKLKGASRYSIVDEFRLSEAVTPTPAAKPKRVTPKVDLCIASSGESIQSTNWF